LTEMVFIMPQSIYSDVRELPIPNDENVHLAAVKPFTVAVAGSTGRWTMKNVEELETQLRGSVAKEAKFEIKPNAKVQLARFDSPMTPPWWRRNEVWLTIV